MKLLLADDDPVTRRVARARLALLGYQVVEAGDGAEALAALSEPAVSPRIAILDWDMPAMTGPDVCRAVRQARLRDGYTYIFLVTSRTERGDLMAGLDAGADDYLYKPLDFAELELRLRTAHRVLDLETRLTSSRDALQHQAAHDVLTGAYHRSFALAALSDELARHARGLPAPALILADIDQFKLVNDNFGHATGDEVLRQAVQRMSATLRPYDRLSRWGGEEFLFLLPGCGAAGAANAAERMRQALCATPILVNERSISVTASFGVAAPEQPGEDADALIRRVDAALTAAKRASRDRESVRSPGGGAAGAP